jgi:hypothetical protein
MKFSRICQRILFLKVFWVQFCANFAGKFFLKKKEAGEETHNG